MDFKLFNWLKPAEGEDTVRSYHCTSLKSRLLNLKAEGFLTVTNKRVVFHAFGSSYTGDSVLQSEVPIEDVSGITCYSGGFFSFSHLLTAFFGSWIISAIVNAVVIGGFVNAVFRSIRENLTYETLNNLDSYIIAIRIFLWIIALGCLFFSFRVPRDKIYRSILATLSTIFLVELGGFSYASEYLGNFAGSLLGTGSSDNVGAQFTILLAVIVGIYALVCIFWYSLRRTMSLFVGSKGGSNTPIAISGVRSFSAAGRALGAEPAEDAETMIKQLGAVITDIQVLGDLGINKWKV